MEGRRRISPQRETTVDCVECPPKLKVQSEWMNQSRDGSHELINKRIIGEAVRQPVANKEMMTMMIIIEQYELISNSIYRTFGLCADPTFYNNRSPSRLRVCVHGREEPLNVGADRPDTHTSQQTHVKETNSPCHRNLNIHTYIIHESVVIRFISRVIIFSLPHFSGIDSN